LRSGDIERKVKPNRAQEFFSGEILMSRDWLKQLASRKQKPRSATQRRFRPRVEALESRLVLSQFFEAETALLGGISPYFDGGGINNYPRVEDITTSGQTNYDGPGYVNLAYSDDSMITWDNVAEDHAGDYTLAFRYSMDTYYTNMWVPARPMGLMVNGNVLTRALNFVATGDSTTGVDPWSTWKDLPITVHLNAGVNTIELFATDLAASGANPHLDSLTVTAVTSGIAPTAPTDLIASAGVGDVDLSWKPSALASSYNIYRSTSSGSETLIAGGVTANYFFDTGLARDGTSYFYQVSAVNDAGASARTNEVSATPRAPAGLVFSDDFSNGPSAAWSFTPATDYWLPQVGQLTDAGGDTVANVTQAATVVLPSGTVAWQAQLLTKEGHAAPVDPQGNPGISGIYIQSTDGLNAVWFGVFPDDTVNVGTVVGGTWQDWTQVGTAPTISHPAGVELLWHTYQIRLDSGGTFSLLFDGDVLRSGISAGPASAWAGGVGTGALFTWSNLDDRHLSTAFDNVRAFGPADSPGGGGGGGQGNLSGNDSADAAGYYLYRAASTVSPPLLVTGLNSTAFATFGLSNGTTYFSSVIVVNSAEERGPANEASASPQEMVSVLDATASDGYTRLSRMPAARATRGNLDAVLASDGETPIAKQAKDGVRILFG
jgi:hypothetical protein